MPSAGWFNVRERGAPEPSCAIFRHDVPGLYALRVRELAVRGLRLEWDEGLPDFFTHGLWLEQCRGAEVAGFVGSPNPGATNAAANVLNEGDGAEVRNCRATAGARPPHDKGG